MKAPELSTLRHFFERTVPGLIASRSLMALVCAQMVFFGQMTALMAAPPVADAGPDLVVEKNTPLGAEVELDGSGSTDPDGDPLNYLWLGSFGSAAVAVPVVSFDTGSNVVSLRVDDGTEGSDLDNALVEVVPCFDIAVRAKATKVQVSWPAQAGAQKYEVYRSDQNTPSNFVKIGERPAGILVYIDTTLASGRTYLYVVNAVTADGRSCFSSVASAHPARVRGVLKRAPVIYSEAPTTGTVEAPYFYDVNASDPNGQAVTYSLDSSPAGMSIDPASGLVQWTPPAAGDENVTVRAADPDGLFDTQSFVVTVDELPGLNSAPVADAGADQLAAVGDTVTLDGSGSSDADGDPLTYSWSLTLTPAGSSAALSDPNAVAPTFVVDGPGVYVAELVVNDGLVDSAPDTTVVVTVNSAPVADAGPDQTALVGETVTLDGSGSSDLDADPLTYSWSLSAPAGSSAALSDPNAVMPSFVVDVAGSYTAQLIVNDGFVDSAPDTMVVTTDNSPPVADAGPDQTVLVGDTVALDGSGSSDVDGDALTFSWALTSVPAGSAAALSDPAAVAPTFVADVAGSYVAQLIVNDGTVDSAPDTITITTGNSPPVAEAGPGQSVLVGDTVTLDGSGSSDVDGDPLTYFWSLSSVPPGSAAAVSDPTAVAPTFVADVAGTYVAQLIVNDGTVDSAPDTVTITTGNSPPTANAGPDQTALVGDTVTLDGSGSNDVDGDPLTFSWSLSSVPAGSSAALSDPGAVMPNFVADVAGTYVAQLIVNDGTVDSAPDTVTITTDNSPPTANAGPDQTVLVGDTVTLDGGGSSDVDGDALTFSWALTSVPPGSAAALSDPSAVMPTFVADQPGTYVAQLIVNDGTVDSAPDTVTITTGNTPPVADAGPNQTVLVGDLVTLDGSGSSDVDGDALTFSWSLTSVPAGSAAALGDPGAVMPSFVADVAGSYVAQLVVNDATVDSAPDTVTIVTGNSPPVADAGPDQTVALGSTVTLDGRGSSDVDVDPLTYFWSLTSVPAGSAAALGDPFAEGPVFVADVAGTYIAQLIVNDGTADSAPDCVTITTANSRPVAEAGPSLEVELGSTVTLDGSGSSDADGDPLTFSWSFTSQPTGSTAALSDPTAVSPTFVPEVEGFYILQLIVSDGVLDSAPDTVTFFGFTPTVTVPDVVGLPQAAAESAVLGAGLAVGAVTTAHSETVPAGNVISQNPAGGADAPLGSSVDLVISLGPEPVVVPDVVGLPQGAAEAALVGAGLTVGAVSTANSTTVPAGDVISQDPAGGASVTAGDAVDLVVSLGPPLVVVPDVVGLPQAAAEAAIVAADLTVGAVSTANSDTVPAGDVISQNPAGGSTAEPGSAVDLVVSLGPSAVLDTLRPEVTLIAIPGPIVGVGTTISLQVTANDNVGVVGTALTIGSVPVLLDPSGVGTFSSAAPGLFVAEATATDAAGNTGNANVELRFLSPGDTTPPVVNITSPANDAILMTPADVVGTASDANLIQFVLEIAKKGSNEFVSIATGNTSVINDVLGQVDPTIQRNGLYDLRLTAEDASGNVNTTTTTIQLDGEQKVGNFTVSFNDLSIPVSGIPITVTRTYDSRLKSKGDFGIGWSLGLDNAELDENRDPSSGWELFCTRQLFGTCLEWGIRPSVEHTVVITRGDGRTDEFRINVNATFAQPGGLAQGNLTFSPLPGTFSTLQALDSTTFDFLIGGQLLDFGFNPIDPNRYRLTDPDGTSFVIRQGAGIESITDPNGNTITIGPGGIIHSAGQSVIFARDGQGRITSITDPSGSSLEYEYDFYGDLVAVADRQGGVSNYQYNSNHGLLQINDPGGTPPIRVEYDNDGRLLATTDAEGNRIEFSHNVTGREEVVQDRRGNIARAVYDSDGNVTSHTNALGNVTQYTYDADGNETSVTDSLGNTTTRSFDARGNVLNETDPLGNITTQTYDAKGRVLTTTEAGGGTTTNIYDAKGNLTQTIDADGNITANTYDGQGRLLTVTDPLGNITQYSYDALGNRTGKTDPTGALVQSGYDANGNEVSREQTRTTPSGPQKITTLFEYDASDRLTAEVDAEGNRSETSYDVRGNVQTETDNNGNVTTYEYDLRGNIIRRSFPDGTEITSTYDAEGNEISRTDQAGRTTLHTYDAVNNLIAVVHPDGTSLQSVFGPAGHLIAEIDEDGNRTDFAYDAAGRHLRTTDALGNVTRREYDPDGNNTAKIDANGNRTEFQYDDLGHLVQTVFPDGTTTSTTYDGLGQKLTETDQAGNVTSYDYDAAGRLTNVTDALGGVTSYTYDEVGNKLTQTDANGNTTSWAYDDIGRIVSRTLPGGQTESFTHDGNGNRLTHTDFNGDTTRFEYDALNRLTRTAYPDTSVVTHTYTATGKLASITDSRGLTLHSYDQKDRLLRIDYPDGSFVGYEYDGVGNVTSLETQSGTTSYSYDALKRLATVTGPDGGVTSYAYDSVGNRSRVEHPNGTQTVYAYDTLNRLLRLENLRSDSTVISTYAYTLGPAGNRTQVVETGATLRTVNYTYDALYRLTREVIAGSPSATAIDYVYDAVGNRLSKTQGGAVTPYAYDGNDRLLAEGTLTYTYDANGNRTSRSDGVDSATYGYDAENRLVTAVEGALITSYGYDAHGNRVRSVANGVVTNYLVDPNREHSQVLEERDATGTLLVRYVHGDDLLSQSRPGGVNYYHYDGLGSTRALTDAAEAVTDSYEFDAFGLELDRTGTTENSFLFTGEQLDANIGFYYLRSRFYDPSTGRFLSMDSYAGRMFDPISLHKYLYAADNPANRVDPSGRFSIGSFAISIAIGGILNSILSYEAGQTLSQIATNFLIGAIEGAVFYGIGGAAIKFFKFVRASRLTGAITRYLARIVPRGPPIPGFSNLYRQMVFNTSVAGPVQISSGGAGGAVTGALKHVVNDILRKAGTGSAARTQLAEVLALKELEAAINLAALQGIRAGEKIIVTTSYARWELIFEGAPGVAWKLFHALPRVL